jgi:uncharacterized membrane protein YbhN (UPF0104 family)
MSGKSRTWVVRTFAVLAIGLGGWLLYRAAGRYSLVEIWETLETVTASRVLACLGFAGASYFCLTINDWLALRYVGRPLPYRFAALAAFVSLSLGHNIGFSGLSSGTIRYRFYSRWGLDAAEVAKIVLFSGATVTAGLLSWAAVILVAAPEMVSPNLRLAASSCRWMGAFFGGVVAGYLVLALVGKAEVSFRRWTLGIPPPSLAFAQCAVGIVNYACVSACLKTALDVAVSVEYLRVAAAFVVGNIATLLTHIPGGLGVIETAVLYIVPNGASLGGGLVLFRLAYYLLPLTVGLLIFFFYEAALRKRGKPTSQRPGRID